MNSTRRRRKGDAETPERIQGPALGKRPLISPSWIGQQDFLPASDRISQWRRFRVRAAFFAVAERDRAERCLAARFACLDNACLDAERRLSRLSARFVARERFRDGFLRRPARPFARSRLAWRFVRCLPRFGGGNFIPALRALERPIAMACSGERAPCSPSRMCSISSRTNSPA